MIAPVERAVRALAFVACLVAVVASMSCDKIELTAPSGSTVTVFSNLTTIALGGSAEVTATVIEAGGTPVHDGTEVSFTTTIGTIGPSPGQTDDGIVKAILRPGNQSGTAVVRAFSGGATSGPLEIIIGAAAVSRIVLTANPSSVSATRGGTVALSAFVVDEGNNPVPNVSVNFTTTAGSLTSTRVTTDANGEARNSLTTNRETRVRAIVGATESNEITIAANAAPNVTVTPSPATVNENQVVTFTFNVTPTTGVAVSRVTIDYGDGQSDNLGTQLSGSLPHTYRDDGVYAVVVRATDVNGEVGSASTAVVVTPAPSLLVTVTVQPNPTTANTLTTITVTLTNSALQPLITNVSYDFGDGTSQPTGGLTAQHIYTRAQDVVVKARVTLNDGRSSEGQQQVIVRP